MAAECQGLSVVTVILACVGLNTFWPRSAMCAAIHDYCKTCRPEDSTPREVLCRCCLHVKLSLGHHHDHAVAADAAPMTMQRTSSNLRSVHCPASLQTPGRSAAGSQPSCKQRTLGFMAIGYGGLRLAGC